MTPTSLDWAIDDPRLAGGQFRTLVRSAVDEHTAVRDAHNRLLVLGYRDTREALRDWHHWTTEPGHDRPLAPLEVDPPRHRHYRLLLDAVFSGPAYEQAISGLAADVVGCIGAHVGDTVRLVGQVVEPAVVTFISRIADLSAQETEEFQAAAWEAFLTDYGPGSDADVAVATVVRDMYYRRCGSSGSSSLNQWANDPRNSRDEVYGLYINVVVASYHNLVRLLANILSRLNEQPAAWGDIAAAAFASEVARLEPSLTVITRRSRGNHHISDHTVAAGETLWLCLYAANRDPRVFDEPDKLDIHRTQGAATAYGGGPHHCAGRHTSERVALDIIRRLMGKRLMTVRTGEPLLAATSNASPGALNEQLATVRTVAAK